MTTIAFDGYDLAADGQSTQNGKIIELTCKKIYDIGDGVYFAGAGNGLDCEIVANWLKAGEDPKAKPIKKKRKGDDAFEALIVGPGGCNVIDGDLYPVPMQGPQAIGSGWVEALTAMTMGKTAKQAVEIAMELDVHTGGEIQVVHINKRKLKR